MKLAITILFIGFLFLDFTGCSLKYPSRAYPPHNAGRISPVKNSATHLRTKISTNNAPPKILSLEQIVKIALTNNPDCAMAYWDSQAADAQYSILTAERMPHLHGAGAYYHYKDDQRLIPAKKNGESGVFSNEILSADVVMKMPIFTGGRIASEIKAADFTRQAAKQRLSRSRQELIFKLSNVFYTLLEQEKVIASVEFSKQALAQHRQRILHIGA